MKTLIMIFLLISTHHWCFGQADRILALSELKRLAEAYKNINGMSAEITYRYASEQNPDVVLDSLTGKFILLRNKFWYSLDGTQTVYDGRQLLSIYGDDNVIYLSRPAATPALANPVASLDSVLDKMDIIYSLTESGNQKVVTLEIRNDARLKELQYEIDKKTGLLRKLRQTVSSDQFYDHFSQQEVQKNSYNIVETTFTYKKEKPNPEVFELDRYVVLQGDRYIPAKAYSAYKVFVASPEIKK